MPGGTNRSAVGTIIFPQLWRVERSLPGLSQSIRFISIVENVWAKILTHKHDPHNFFSDPPGEIFDHNAFNAKALSHYYLRF